MNVSSKILKVILIQSFITLNLKLSLDKKVNGVFLLIIFTTL